MGDVLGGRYRVLSLIGRGGVGEVYAAQHTTLPRRVAVKVLRPWYADDPAARARFMREGEAAARVRHPHAVEIVEHGEDGDVQYLVMELLEGEDLGRRLAARGAMDVAAALDVMLPVLAAVAAAHDAGVVHRDLKPANVFLAHVKGGAVTPRVLDFGIARVADDAARPRTENGAHLGTPSYMAPELARSARDATPASDQYALGVMLYECLAGANPFAGVEGVYAVLLKIAEGQYPRLRARRPSVPRPLDAVVRRAMALDPAARHPSVRALGAALLPFANRDTAALWRGELGASAVTSSAVVRRRAPPLPRWLLAAAPFALGVASGALARALVTHPRPASCVATARVTRPSAGSPRDDEAGHAPPAEVAASARAQPIVAVRSPEVRGAPHRAPRRLEPAPHERSAPPTTPPVPVGPNGMPDLE